MLETKAEEKTKSEVRDDDSAKVKPAKSPQVGEAAAKVKKEVKLEPESPPQVKKKHSQTSVKAAKKESEVCIKASKKEEKIKTQKGDTPGKVKVVKKEEVVASTVSSHKKKKGSKEESEKKSKKVYSLPGQKHDPPDERDPLRIFYETLYEQNSNSEMAEIWMMEHGLLEEGAAKKAFERKKKNQVSQKVGTPVKQLKAVKVERSSTSVVVKSLKKTPAEKLGKKSVNGKGDRKLSKSPAADNSGKKSTHGNGDSKPSKVKRVRDSDEEDDDDDDFILKPKKKSKADA